MLWLACAVIMLMAGCRLEASAPRPATPVASAPVLEDHLAVGVALSLTGQFSQEGAALRAGYETWAAAVNAQGGIAIGADQRPVELVIVDDESDALTAARVVERLVTERGVRFLLGPFSTQITSAVSSAASRHGVLTVAADGPGAELFSREPRMLVSVLPTEDRFFESLLQLAASVPPRRKSAVFLVNEDPFLVAAALAARERAKTLGIDVTVERAPIGARDLTPVVARIASANPAVLVVGGDDGFMSRAVARLRELRLSPPIRAVLAGENFHDASHRLGRDADGVLTIDWWSDRMRVGGAVLGTASDYAARFTTDHGYPPDARSAAASAAGLALQLGIERAGALDPSQVRAALGEVDVETFWGRLAWDRVGRSRYGVPAVMQWDAGQAYVVWPPAVAERSPRYPVGAWPSLSAR